MTGFPAASDAGYFATVETARAALVRRLTGELPAGATRFLGLLGDAELRHGRPRRTRRLLAQARRRLVESRSSGRDRPTLPSAGEVAAELAAFGELLASWPRSWIRGPGIGDLVLASGLHSLALQPGQPRARWELHRLALISARRVLPERHPQLVDLELHFARALAEVGRFDEALGAIRRAEEIARELPWPALVAFCRGQHAEVLLGDRRRHAARLARSSLALYRRLFEPGHPGLLPSLRRLRRTLEGSRADLRSLDALIAGILARHLGPRSNSGAGQSQAGDEDVALEE